MRWLRAVLVVLVLAGLGVAFRAAPAFACSCVGYTAQEAYDAADVVFAGRVVKVQEPVLGPIISSVDPVTLTFDVTSVLKGSVPANAKVQTARDGASCGYDFSPGVRYLVHARQGEPLTTGLCSGNLVITGEAPAGDLPDPPTPEAPVWPWGVGLGVALLAIVGAVLLIRRRRLRS